MKHYKSVVGRLICFDTAQKEHIFDFEDKDMFRFAKIT